MHKTGRRGLAKHIDFVIIDIICMYIAYFAGTLIRDGKFVDFADDSTRATLIFYLVANILVAITANSYKNILARNAIKELFASLKHVIFISLFVVFGLFIIKISIDQSRIALVVAGVIYLILTFVCREIWKKIIHSKKKGKESKRSLLIITTEQKLEKTIENINKYGLEMYSIKGAILLDVDAEGKSYTLDGIQVDIVANSANLISYVCNEWLQDVFINISPEDPAPDYLVSTLLEMGVVVHRRLFIKHEEGGWQENIEKLGRYTVLTMSIRNASSLALYVKRLFDIIGGLVGTIITFLIAIVLGPLIKIKSPGPVFFKQERVGINGKTFYMYKFRSMYPDAEERKKEFMEKNRMDSNLMFKLDFDPRVIGNVEMPDGTRKTGIGQFIRDTSLDEFPQFINVLKGEMSLIGTRPPLTSEVESYSFYHRCRLSVKPGLTGMWQVSGRSEITDFDEIVNLDRKYIAEWSLGLDVKILFKTIGVVLKRKGSM